MSIISKHGSLRWEETYKLVMNENRTGQCILSVFIWFATRNYIEISEKGAGKWVQRVISCMASAHPLYHYTSSHQTQLDSCRWHLVWRVWRLIEDLFDAGGIESNTLAFQLGVLPFEVLGQRREAQACSGQLLLTLQEKCMSKLKLNLKVYQQMKRENELRNMQRPFLQNAQERRIWNCNKIIINT